MKKLLVSLVLALGLGVAAAQAAVTPYYLDPACDNNGNGLVCESSGLLDCTDKGNWVCAAAPNGAGPKNSLTSALALLTAGDKQLFWRGSHTAASHTVSSANHAAGTYDGRTIISGHIDFTADGTSGHPIIITAFGFSNYLAATQEAVYLEMGSVASSWTQCSDCTGGTEPACQGLPGTCSDGWFAPVSGTYYMTTYNGGLNMTPNMNIIGEVSQQYQSVQVGSNVLVRWGGSLPSGVLTILSVRDDILDVGSDYLTIQGIVFRNGARSMIQSKDSLPNTGLTIEGCKFYNNLDHGDGSARAVTLEGQTSLVLRGNELYNTSSEPLHFDGSPGVLTWTGDVYHNWIHDIGDRTMLGTRPQGTSNCTTIGAQDGSQVVDWTGFDFHDNLIERCNKLGQGGRGIMLEASINNAKFRDNVVRQAGPCVRLATEGYTQSGNEITGNLCFESGMSSGAPDTSCIMLIPGSGIGPFHPGPISGNKIEHNTCYRMLGYGVQDNGASVITSNKVRNNIFVKEGAQQIIGLSTSGAGNLLEGNILADIDGVGDLIPCSGTFANSTLVVWQGASYTCATLQGAGLLNAYAHPQFRDAANRDLRLAPNSPAIDWSVTPASTRSAGMMNTAAHDFVPSAYPRMDEGAAKTGAGWDAGAFETRIPYPGFESSVLSGRWAYDTVTGWKIATGGGCAGTLFGTSSTAKTGLASGSLRGRITGPACGDIFFTMTNLVVGRTYTILGYYQASGSLGAGDQQLDVLVDAVQECSIEPGTAVSTWTAFPACDFVATATSEIIAFSRPLQAAGDTTFLVDELEVVVSN